MRSLIGLRFSLCCVLAALAFTTSAFAADSKVKLTLVWGTDEEKPADPKLKPANKDMVAQFRQVCKWKYYFEVTNSVATVSAQPSRVRLSPKCEVEVQDVGKEGLAAKLIGEGNKIWTGKSKVETGKHWGIGGNAENATAWFVVLTPQ